MSTPKLQFKPINLDVNGDQAIRFREDSFICSFGDAARFNPSEYVGWLKAKLEKDPSCGVHIWLDQQLIGQMELGQFKPEPSAGYINLYYLIPEMRGKGFSDQLDEYAMSVLKRKGFNKAYLSVSPTNPRAIRYYSRMGWIDRGSRSEAPEVILMEKQIP
jgi:GNAT superfamily N-acetyltransferase